MLIRKGVVEQNEKGNKLNTNINFSKSLSIARVVDHVMSVSLFLKFGYSDLNFEKFSFTVHFLKQIEKINAITSHF